MNPVHRRDKLRSALHFPGSVARSHLCLLFQLFKCNSMFFLLSFTGSKSRRESDSAFHSFGECWRNHLWAGWVSGHNISYYLVIEKLVFTFLALFYSPVSPYRRSEAVSYSPRQNFRGYFPGGENSPKPANYVSWECFFFLCHAIKNTVDGFHCRTLLRFARPSWNGTLRKFVSPSLPSPKTLLSETRPGTKGVMTAKHSKVLTDLIKKCCLFP